MCTGGFLTVTDRDRKDLPATLFKEKFKNKRTGEVAWKTEVIKFPCNRYSATKPIDWDMEHSSVATQTTGTNLQTDVRGKWSLPDTCQNEIDYQPWQRVPINHQLEWTRQYHIKECKGASDAKDEAYAKLTDEEEA
jgi:hypothetical protein